MMSDLLQIFPTGDAMIVLVLVMVKTSFLILLAAAITFAWRSAPASLRHCLWVTTLVGVLLMPVFAAMVPQWEVPLLVLPEGSSAPSSSVSAVPADVALEHQTTAFDRSAVHAPRVDPSPRTALPADAVPRHALASASITSLLAMVWLCGFVLVMLYFGIGVLRAWIWSRRSSPIEDDAWTAQIRDLAWMMGIERAVVARWCTGATMPMTWGTRRPIILLPTEASEWSDERRRVVLLHELAHVRRFDCLTQYVVQITCAINWFNPLVWWAAGRARSEREHACDEAVLRNGARPSSYASHLLEIARSARSRFTNPVGAVAMARQSELEGRVIAILDFTHTGNMLRRGTVVFVACASLPMLLLLAAFSPVSSANESAATVMEDAGAYVEEIGIASSDHTERTGARTSADAGAESDVIHRRFDVRHGGKLVVDSDLGSIDISTSSGQFVDVEIVRETRGLSGARPEGLQVSFEHRGNEVRVMARRTDRGANGVNARFVITVPHRFNVDLETRGGSINVDDLEGNVTANTSGGSLLFGRIAGDVDARTSGGSIRLDRSSGSAILNTSGGSIRAGEVEGDLEARTSGGSLSISDVKGSLVAVTSGGSISARMSQPPRKASHLETSGGSVTLDLHSRAAVSLDASTSAGHVTTDFNVPERPDNELSRLRADINGGGPDLVLRTSAGNIRINRIGATGDARSGQSANTSSSIITPNHFAADFASEEFAARMEILGADMAGWSSRFEAETREWLMSPEFAAWVEELSLAASEISLDAVEESLSYLDANTFDEGFLERLREEVQAALSAGR